MNIHQEADQARQQEFTHTIHDPLLHEQDALLSMTAHLDLVRRGAVRLCSYSSDSKSKPKAKPKLCNCGFYPQKRSQLETVGILAQRTERLAQGKQLAPTIQNKHVGNPVALAILELECNVLKGDLKRTHADGHVCTHELQDVPSDEAYVAQMLSRFDALISSPSLTVKPKKCVE